MRWMMLSRTGKAHLVANEKTLCGRYQWRNDAGWDEARDSDTRCVRCVALDRSVL